MRYRSAFIRGIQQLLGREHADPRVAQYLFALPVALDVAFVHLHGDGSLSRTYLGGLALILVVTVVGIGIGRGFAPERWSILVPTVDIVALGALRTEQDSTAAVILAFPAIWIGLQFGRRGVAAGTAAVGAGFVLPMLVRDESSAEIARTSQQIVLAAICALVVTVTAEMWQNKVGEAADAQRMLERAVADSADHRRFNEAILNSVDVGLLALDGEGRVHSVNPRYSRFLETVGGSDGSLDRVGRTFGPDGFTELAS